MSKIRLNSFFVATALLITTLSAQVPQLINYQGRVAVDGVNFDGAGSFKFALVDGGTSVTPSVSTATGTTVVNSGFVTGITITHGGQGYITAPAVTISGDGTGATATATLTGDVVSGIIIDSPGSGYNGAATVSFEAPPAPIESIEYVTYWSNDGTSNDGSEPSAAVSLPVKKGLYSVLLGDANLPNMTIVPATIFANPDVRLRVWFDDGVKGVQQLTPDQRIAAVGYAVMAGTVADGAITSAKLAPNAVSESLASSGQGTVPSGAMLISTNPADQNLIDQGYALQLIRMTSTSPADPNTPSARRVHTAVWTGSKMIVWGGYDTNSSSSQLSTGSVYDTATNSWATVSPTGAPSARASHTAVWTGSKMIIWGGYDGSSLNTGGVYDPDTNSWATVTPTGAPSARSSHTAVWTGSKMIIWGGSDGSSLNTGGVYDPDTNSWTTVTSTGAPSARRIHTAVWTGSKMIIWGGSDGSYFNTGGEYDPYDLWIKTTDFSSGEKWMYLYTRP